MYRLMLYYLIGLVLVSVILALFGAISYNPLAIIFSASYITFVTYLSNKIFSRIFSAPTNVESVYITALILTMIVSPELTATNLLFMGGAGILSTASKYILAIGKKHIFNPAAISVVLTGIFFRQYASWWLGSLALLPYVVIGGLLIARKIKRGKMVLYFILSTVLTVIIFTLFNGGNATTLLKSVFLHSAFFFFAFVMFTEPFTTPVTSGYQILYGILVGYLYAPVLHFGNLYFAAETALCFGNIFSYLVSPKEKLILRLTQKIKLSLDVWEFIFPLKKKLAFVPGQYMEWTLPHGHSDNRGNRRYFTLASSPTEKDLRIAVKFNNPSSSFKKAMLKNDQIAAGNRAGNFTLPNDKNENLVFMAGGIGITPFRSMIKYLLDKGEARDIILMYSNKFAGDVVFKDLFDQATTIGLRTIYTITDTEKVPATWKGKVGRVDANMLINEIPDYKERKFYISGPHAMVEAFKATLKNIGIAKSKIKEDFFPGYV